jgi:hypothetical protein
VPPFSIGAYSHRSSPVPKMMHMYTTTAQSF